MALCPAGFYHLRHLCPLLRSLTHEAARTLVQAFISSRLDCCNSLLYGISQSLIRKVQSIQNAVARLITGAKWGEHISPVLHQLHWLPVQRHVGTSNWHALSSSSVTSTTLHVASCTDLLSCPPHVSTSPSNNWLEPVRVANAAYALSYAYIMTFKATCHDRRLEIMPLMCWVFSSRVTSSLLLTSIKTGVQSLMCLVGLLRIARVWQHLPWTRQNE